VALRQEPGPQLRIPYTFEGEAANYVPDLIVRYDDGGAEPLILIIEVTGEHRREKAAKPATAETYWVPAVNNHGGLGRWSFWKSPIVGRRDLILAHVVHSYPRKGEISVGPGR